MDGWIVHDGAVANVDGRLVEQRLINKERHRDPPDPTCSHERARSLAQLAVAALHTEFGCLCGLWRMLGHQVRFVVIKGTHSGCLAEHHLQTGRSVEGPSSALTVVSSISVVSIVLYISIQVLCKEAKSQIQNRTHRSTLKCPG